MASRSTPYSRTTFKIPTETYAYNQGVKIKEGKSKESHDTFKSRDQYSGSWIKDERYDRENGTIYETKMTSRGSDRSERHSFLGPRNHVESLVNPFSSNWVLNGRSKSLPATSSELPISAGSNNGTVESAAAKKNKSKKRENQSMDDIVVPRQRSNGTIIKYPNTRSRQINPSLRSIHPLIRNAESKSPAAAPIPVFREAKTIEKIVKQLTKETDSSGKTQRISRSQRRKARRIVLKKQHPVASVETLSGITRSKKDGKGKRRNGEADDAQNAVPVKRKRLSSEVKVIKNSNSDWHCLNKTIKCQLCKTSPGKSLVSHYVNCHPYKEVFPCRVAPHVADFLRHSTEVHEVEHFMPRQKICNEFRQRCYFCNEVKSFTKSLWRKHMVIHTGYYSYKCSNCERRFAASTPYHACDKGKIKNRVVNEAMPQFNDTDVFAYLCDLCNFVRLEESEMEKHMSCEHEGNVTRKFKKVTFLRFPKKERKNHIVVEQTMNKLSNTMENLDDVATGRLEQSPRKILQMNVVHSEALIAEPIEDIGHNTVKLMEDTPVTASEDAECSSRAKSIAVKFNPSYNSLQVEGQIISTDGEQSESSSFNRIIDDEGISIVVTAQAISGYYTLHSSVVETSKENPSSTTAVCVNGENYVPTNEQNYVPTNEQYFVESNDNYESSLNSREDESKSMQVPSPLNRNNVGINDTIASLQQSISTQSESPIKDGLDKIPKTMPLSDSNSKRQTDSSITTIFFYILNTFISIGILLCLLIVFIFLTFKF